jgi:WD40 repeat protein
LAAHRDEDTQPNSPPHTPGTTQTFSTRTGDVTAFAVHPYAPIIASGSQNQKIHMQDFDGLELNQIRYHEGFLGQRIGPVSCLAFHPYEPSTKRIITVLLACAKQQTCSRWSLTKGGGIHTYNRFRMYLAAGATDSILSIYTHAHNKTYYE